MRSIDNKFYQGQNWKKTRNAYYISQNGICERCGGIGRIVHHKKHLNKANQNDFNLTLHWENLELLCQDCHNKEHFERSCTVEGLKFDENGDLVKVFG
ncbi:HNH endonuclease [Campylobacter showae]|uniref:HNH endonuclease n=1 Tax=Campylobacter showae TaxID=204 RepID=UPI0026EDEDCE|nr:HNH endonuclease [Campylobacter showae]